MALCVLLLCSLFGGLLGQGGEHFSLDDCCKHGQKYGNNHKECTSLPLISGSPTCRIVQEQCCVTVLEDNMCTIGINVAKEQGACDSLLTSTCETKTTKMCCDCCLLGRAAHELDVPCDHSLSVGYQCSLVSRACCVDGASNNQTSQSGPTELPNKDGTSEAGDHSVPDDQCKGKCAHLCVGNNTCGCLKGYKLRPDGKSCEDINECLLGSSNCRVGERCINTEGAFRCIREVSCGTGYELTESNNCKDIDECETGIHNCGQQFECQNTQGSFRCIPKVKCGNGFIQDALGNCIDINECVTQTSPCNRGHICINTVGSYICQRNSVNCGRGYHLSDDGTRCVDIDECKGPQEVCSGHACINQLGSYRCECETGYNFNSITRLCEDINECRHYPGRLCAHKCENTPGSYQCSCTTGFKLSSDGRNCDDLNECESNPCSQECANVYGSYQCYCRRGYQLSDIDAMTCEDIDECALPTGGHICSYRCHNTPGSFHCSCPVNGYTLAINGRSCQDVDECVTGRHTCAESESCFNIQGGFRCLSFDCPHNYRRVGQTRCERLLCNEPECLNIPMRITYYYLTLSTNTPASTTIFRMGPSQTMPGDDIHIAIIAGNDDGFFKTERTLTGGAMMVAKVIDKPQDFELSLELRLRRYGSVIIFLAKVLVFATQDEPRVPYNPLLE
ncbi:fibulin-1 isoform X2 [Nothobranchius furzeri]|uniref:Fibulin-1 n=4 Tax=Nothobranchius TaxID=28779 RepID=A0A1A8UVX9_NOTFU|nr:fibulin-1 isoform X2 [Nothobranchius furzeri]KAF7225294.1 transcript variant X1 [Nothobranchius furzeri]